MIFTFVNINIFSFVSVVYLACSCRSVLFVQNIYHFISTLPFKIATRIHFGYIFFIFHFYFSFLLFCFVLRAFLIWMFFVLFNLHTKCEIWITIIMHCIHHTWIWNTIFLDFNIGCCCCYRKIIIYHSLIHMTLNISSMWCNRNEHWFFLL